MRLLPTIQGIGLFLQGESDAALVALKRSVELDPQRSSAFTKLGSIELDIGDLGEARRILERALVLNGDEKFAHQRLGVVLERQGDRAGAIREYGLAIAGEPSQVVTAKVDLGRLYNLDGRFTDTIALLEPGVTPQSSDPAALLVLGTAYLGVGNTAKALPLMWGTQTRFPNDPSATLSVGIAERAAGQLDASVFDLKHAIDLKKDWSTAYYQLGLTYLAQSKYPKLRPRSRRRSRSIPAPCRCRRAWAKLCCSVANLTRLSPYSELYRNMGMPGSKIL